MRPSYEYFDIYEKKVKENKDTHTDTGLYYVWEPTMFVDKIFEE